MNKRSYRWILLGVMLVMGLMFSVGGAPRTVHAATDSCQIKSCQITTNKKNVKVKVKVKKKTKAMGKKLYLIAYDSYATVGKSTTKKPVANAKAKKGTVTFTTKLNYGKSNSRLFSKFAVAYKKGKKYMIISEASYITNPEKLATFKEDYPKTYSKKGLQTEGVNDVDVLGNQYTIMNWRFNDIFKQNGGIEYKYKGTTYHFNAEYLTYYDRMVGMYNEYGSKVTVILLLSNEPRSDINAMMYRGSGAYYSGINTATKKGSKQLEAVMSYLAERYGKKEHLVSGWILGNEIGNTKEWNYGGGKKFNAYMENYVRGFRICNTAVRSVNKNAQVYLSLDYYWNKDQDGAGNTYFSSRNILDTFHSKLKKQGLVDWHIAYHAYSQGLVYPEFWDDDQAVNSVDSEIVTFRNIKVLTNYVKKNFGKNVKIMMSEQSFNSNKGELMQAAAFAYAYYICEANSMIEAFIYGRHIDNAAEVDGSGRMLTWGLRNINKTKRLVWDVFQQIDTPQGTKVTKPLLSQISVLSAWTQIPGYKTNKFAKMPSKMSKVKLTGIESVSYGDLKISWEADKLADGYEIYRATSENGTYKLIGTVRQNTTTSYTDKDAELGKTYYYNVRTYRKVGELAILYGSYAKISSAAGLGPITVEKAEPQANAVKLSWKAEKETTGYYIYRAVGDTGAYQLLASIAGGSTNNYTDVTAVAGSKYLYKIVAYATKDGATYLSPESNIVDVMPKPAATTVLNVTPAKLRVTLDWQQVPEAEGYDIYMSDSRDGEYTRIRRSTDQSVLTYQYKLSDDQVVGKEYYFKIRTYVKIGSKYVYAEDSNIVAASAYSRSILINKIECAETVKVGFKGMEEVYGYQIARSDTADGEYMRVADIPETGLGQYTFEDTGVSPAHIYYYKIRVMIQTSDGVMLYSKWSDAKEAIVPEKLPPTGGIITDGEGQEVKQPSTESSEPESMEPSTESSVAME